MTSAIIHSHCAPAPPMAKEKIIIKVCLVVRAITTNKGGMVQVDFRVNISPSPVLTPVCTLSFPL